MEIILHKYKNELLNYKFVEDSDILSLPLGCHIIYFSKDQSVKKSGTLKDIKDISILELRYIKNRWYIYTKNNYIFFKLKTNKLRNSLESLLNSDFKITKKSDNDNKPKQIMYNKEIDKTHKSYLELNSTSNIHTIMQNLEKLGEYYHI